VDRDSRTTIIGCSAIASQFAQPNNLALKIARQPMLELYESGQVLGIDVGFSAKKRSTCFCLLSWDSRIAKFQFRRTTSDEQFQRRALTELLQRDNRLLAVAVDGPLAPGLATVTHYRSPEALLSCGPMQKRGKPGQTSSPVGQALHRHATRLTNLALDVADVSPATHAEPIHAKAVVEAFPNAFLAALLKESEFTTLKRNASDIFWRTISGDAGALRSLCSRLLPECTFATSFEAIINHDEIAGAVCALTALSVKCGLYVAVGDPIAGDIILPPLCVWGTDALGAPWLREVLDAALVHSSRLAAMRTGFRDARILFCEAGKPTQRVV